MSVILQPIKTPLRYPGGKSKAIKTIGQHFPEYKEFREPFIGGGSVFLHLKQTNPDAKYWINDKYHKLYCFWKELRDNGDNLQAELLRLKNDADKLDGSVESNKERENHKALYQKFRNGTFNSDFDIAVAFFVMNKCSFSGLTEQGSFSKQASYRNFTKMNIGKLSKVSSLLKDVQITNEDFGASMQKGGEGVFLYLDPPYDILKGKSKTGSLYGKDGDMHKGFDHEAFAKECEGTKHKFLITYNDSEELRKRFEEFTVVTWNVKYGMNIKKVDEDGNPITNKKFTDKTELLIKNY